MKSYKQFLVEASGKNLHMEHLEDEVLNGGVNGTRGAINFLRSLRDMLAGNNKEAVNVTVKWDGAPAAVAGIHPNGKFFVDYKSMRRPCFTQSDVDEHFGGGPLHSKMSALLEHLPKLNIPGNIFHGDVLWTGADDLNDLRAEFGADINQWSTHNDVWAVNADFTDLSGSATFTQSDTTKITGMLSELGKDFNKVNGRFLDNISKDNIIRTHIKTFMNTKVREGEFVDNYKRSAKDCVKWIENKMQKEVGKLKSERGRQRKQMTVDGYMKTLNGSMDQIEIIFRLMSLINNIKLFIVKKLEEVKGITNTFIKTSSGYRVTKPEGFVAIDTFDNQKGLKLVNRMEFSRINFTAEKEWDQ